MTIVEFLLARIADREALAIDMRHQSMLGRPFLQPQAGGTLLRELIDPARILAECEAKRRIVEAHPLVTDPARLVPVWTGTTPGVACETCQGAGGSSVPLEDIGPCDTLLALAAVDADHPDYDETWRL